MSCKLGLGLQLALLLLPLCLHIAHTQSRPMEYIEYCNDYAHNHDENQLSYTHHYHISDFPNRVHISHREQRQGNYVYGSYSHLEPSGSVRSVHYEVRGDQGYRAVIGQRTANSRVHQSFDFERKQSMQPLQALPLAQPVAYVI